MTREGLPELTTKQLDALLEIHRRWLRGVSTSSWDFGSTTISRLKREGLIERAGEGSYYCPTVKALLLLPDGGAR